jgi:hypothetical protein
MEITLLIIHIRIQGNGICGIFNNLGDFPDGDWWALFQSTKLKGIKNQKRMRMRDRCRFNMLKPVLRDVINHVSRHVLRNLFWLCVS